MVNVYRHYSAAELQVQYSARAAVPEHPQIFQQWREQSERFRSETRCELNISYGEGNRQKLDLFLTDQTNVPLLIFLHGGYWQAMDKSDFSFISSEMIKFGAAVAVVNYDLCPAVSLKAIIAQIQQAIQWLWKHAGQYHIDVERLHLCGHSAGGHLAAMTLTSDWLEEDSIPPAGLIKSVTAMSGLFELEPLIYTPINDALKLDQKSARESSPVLLYPKMKPPFRLFVGSLESDEFHRQSRDLQNAWSHEGVDISYQNLPGLHHFSLVEQLTRVDSVPFKVLCHLMGLRHCQ